MTKLFHLGALIVLSLSVAGCSSEKEAPEADNVTETKMDEVDVIDGTISDDMVDVDAQATGDAMEEESGEGDEKTDTESDAE